jgi:NAD(P)-dependent dehydrogenase (short-subunit alcohol dehydrogenase family)
MKLENKTALITGGSRGLGRALASELGRRGARLVLVARDEQALRTAVQAVERQGARVFGIAADVAEPGQPARVVARAQALAGPVDILINNASSLGPTPLGSLNDLDPGELERVLAVNLVAPFRFTKALVAGMALRAAGGGDEAVVVNISSDAAVAAYPHWGAYGASKAGLDHLTRIWAAELARAGVRMIAVDPGEMNTAMHAAAIPEADPATLRDPAHVARAIADLIENPAAAPTGARLEAEVRP